jgi:hypothetical protein
MQIKVQILFSKLDDRISDELAGTVESGHSAPVNVKYGSPFSPERFFTDTQLFHTAASSDGHNGWMFDQDDTVHGKSCNALRNESLLEV